MDRASVQVWLNAYVEAWRTYDPSKIGELFSEDALYLYSPYDDPPLRGRAAIVASWLEQPDAPGSWTARYEPVAVESETAVAHGRTRYFKPDGTVEKEFDNIFVMHFDEAKRCTWFTEWFMQPRRS